MVEEGGSESKKADGEDKDADKEKAMDRKPNQGQYNFIEIDEVMENPTRRHHQPKPVTDKKLEDIDLTIASDSDTHPGGGKTRETRS